MTARTLTFAAMLFSAAALSQPPSPSRPSRDWKRLVVDDLEAVGNTPERELRRALDELQRFRATLLGLFPRLNARSTERIILVVLRPDTFARLTPRDGRGRRQENVGGYFLHAPDTNLMVVPFQDRDTTFVTVFHEYTHYLVYRNMRNIPRWLNEGMAEFYSTFSVESGGKAVIGKAPPGRLSILQTRSLLPMARFLDPETSSRLFENPSDTALFYTQAWAFVHFMTFGDNGGRRGQISKYLEALQSSPPAEAARAAFGADLEQLDAGLRRYTKQFQLPALMLSLRREGPGADERLEPLTEADVHHLNARLLLDVGATDDAEAALERALADDASHAGARTTLGRVRIHQERHDDALSLLTAVAAERAGDFGAQFFLAAALSAAERYDEALKAYDRAIALRRHSHAAWSGLSAAALALKRDAQANAAMRNAQELYSDPSHYRGRAQFALGLGRNDAAALDVQEYLRLAGWGDDSAPYAAFIGAIAHWRLNQPAEADALLAKTAQAVRPKSWVETVTRYLQGKLGDAAFLDAAEDNGQRTEAHAYIGVRLLHAGRIDEARKHFAWVKERGDRNYTEYGLAIAELKRLDRQ